MRVLVLLFSLFVNYWMPKLQKVDGPSKWMVYYK